MTTITYFFIHLPEGELLRTDEQINKPAAMPYVCRHRDNSAPHNVESYPVYSLIPILYNAESGSILRSSGKSGLSSHIAFVSTHLRVVSLSSLALHVAINGLNKR